MLRQELALGMAPPVPAPQERPQPGDTGWSWLQGRMPWQGRSHAGVMELELLGKVENLSSGTLQLVSEWGRHAWGTGGIVAAGAGAARRDGSRADRPSAIISVSVIAYQRH